MLRVHSEPLYEPQVVPATDVAAAPALTSAVPHSSRLRPRPGRRPDAKAHLTPLPSAPEGHGTFAEAINLERLSTFPRRRLTDKEDDALPYMRRQPQLLSALQFFADAERQFDDARLQKFYAGRRKSAEPARELNYW